MSGGKKVNRLTDTQMRDKVERNLKDHLAANKVKDRLQHKGYTFTVSFYGVILNPESGKPEYRRIEVFINGVPDQIDIGAIKNFFTEIKPYQYYTLWAYNKQKREIIFIEGWS